VILTILGRGRREIICPPPSYTACAKFHEITFAVHNPEPEFDHRQPLKTGVLLTNLGTPDAPTTAAVRTYLAEFLWDRRVIEVPRLIWWFVLRVILLIRPARSAAKYREIWTAAGSPLLVHLERQADAIREILTSAEGEAPVVAVGMRYGQPSIGSALQELHQTGVRKLLVLPLYPQYSATTTASTFDALAQAFRVTRWLPDLRFVSGYYDVESYVDALVESIEDSWRDRERPERLLFSFHGIPKSYFLAGDPYHCQCLKTARLVAEKLELATEFWSVSFQSRLGRTEWLRPYTDQTLEAWAHDGVKRIDVICPGFSADCLETLEEIDQDNRQRFLGAGGDEFHYIAALNDRPKHIEALATLIQDNLHGWEPASRDAENELRGQLASSLANKP